MSIKKLIEATEKKKQLSEFSILDAMQMFDVIKGKVTTNDQQSEDKLIYEVSSSRNRENKELTA